jgi:phage tail sheath protein FI
MPQYFSPGVYIEEIESGPVPIQGVSTNVTGAVGVTERGPTEGKPILVTSFNEYQQTFGGFLPAPQPSDVLAWGGKKNTELGGAWWLFPLAVKGFFDNGGKQLYVKRVYSGTATFATGKLGKGLVSELAKNARAGDTTLAVRHLFGVAKGTKPKYVAAGASLPDTPEVSTYDAKGGTLVVDNGQGPSVPLKAQTDFVEINRRNADPIPANEVTLTFSANARGDWGNLLSVLVRPVPGATTIIQPDATAPVAAFNTKLDAATATWTLTLKDIDVTKLDDTKPLTVQGKDHGFEIVSGANKVKLKDPIDYDSEASQWQEGTTKVSGVSKDVGAAPLSGTIDRADATGWVAKVTAAIDNSVNTLKDGDSVSVAGVTSTISHMDTANKAFNLDTDPSHGTALAKGTLVTKIRPARSSAQKQLDVKDASVLYPKALVELDNGTTKDWLTVDTIVGNVVTFAKNINNEYNEGDKVRVIEAEVGVRKYAADRKTIEAEESFPNLRLSYDDSAPSYIERAIKDQSAFVTVAVGPGLWADQKEKIFDDLERFPTALSGGWQWLRDGHDNSGGLSVDDFVGVDGGSGQRTGIQALEDIDEISICIVPGMWSSVVRDALINHCETLKDRFAIVDPPDGLDVAGIKDYRAPIDTKYAALYYPWIVVRDPSQKRDVNVPPSGHTAGLYVRVDSDRGVHKAPANETISLISAIAQDVNQREQDLLNPIGINALRFFPQRGNRVWGARTLSSDALWKYVNVRRVFIFVEKSIQVGTQWVVFEPNDATLWSRVRQTIENFLTTVWRSGALQGLKASDAFFVHCDLGLTMTQDDIDNGRLIVEIGIAPVKPAEFVIFRIQQKTQTTPTS